MKLQKSPCLQRPFAKNIHSVILVRNIEMGLSCRLEAEVAFFRLHNGSGTAPVNRANYTRATQPLMSGIAAIANTNLGILCDIQTNCF